MTYTLNSLSYDFGQRRANASIQSTSNGQIAFMSVNFPLEAPSNISADALNDYLIEAVRKVLQESSAFVLAPGYKK